MAELDDSKWRMLSEEIFSGMREWRQQHPRATLREIEIETDVRLARLRAQMLQDTALASAATDWASQPATAPPCCPACQQPLTGRGLHRRQLRSQHDQAVELTRQYATCSRCGRGFFPPR